MSLPDLATYVQPTTLVICLCVGYVVKNTKPLENVSNDYIPLIEAILGIVCVSVGALLSSKPVGLETIAQGITTGIVSVGLHQLFTRTIQGLSGTSNETGK